MTAIKCFLGYFSHLPAVCWRYNFVAILLQLKIFLLCTSTVEKHHIIVALITPLPLLKVLVEKNQKFSSIFRTSLNKTEFRSDRWSTKVCTRKQTRRVLPC